MVDRRGPTCVRARNDRRGRRRGTVTSAPWTATAPWTLARDSRAPACTGTPAGNDGVRAGDNDRGWPHPHLGLGGGVLGATTKEGAGRSLRLGGGGLGPMRRRAEQTGLDLGGGGGRSATKPEGMGSKLRLRWQLVQIRWLRIRLF